MNRGDRCEHAAALASKLHTNDAAIFVLPTGYRPSKNVIELAWRGSGTGKLNLLANGSVLLQDGAAAAALDGVTFRAGE